MTEPLVSLVDGRKSGKIPVTDRGLAYGDGLFETVAIRAGQAPLWPWHYERLVNGCKVLGMQVPSAELLEHELFRAVGGRQQAVVKIILTRGDGGRGYLAPAVSNPRRIVICLPWPRRPKSWSTSGVRVRICHHRLSPQPAIAGLKHLNRLDQVLARSEWRSSRIAEGLMLDCEGRIIEGTCSNIVAIIGNQLVTPNLGHCGVAGVMRQWLIAHYDMQECNLWEHDLAQVQSVAVCNSLNGLWPIRQIDGYGHFDVKPIRRMLKDLPWAS